VVPVAAPIVDVEALATVVAASLIAGIGISCAFSLAIVGASGFADRRREGRAVAAAASLLLMAIALGVCVVGIVAGITVMTAK